VNNERERAAHDEDDVTDERPTFVEALQMRVWDLRCWVRRIVRNLFWSREALARREESMQREELEILLSAHGHALTDEERIEAEQFLARHREDAGRAADSRKDGVGSRKLR